MSYAPDLTPGTVVIDTRDLNDYIAEYETDLEVYLDENPDASEYDFQETEHGFDLGTLRFARECAENVEDFNLGGTLICESYFEEYARDFAQDCGLIDEAAAWPACHIDWEGAAEALKQDYCEIQYGNYTYYYR